MKKGENVGLFRQPYTFGMLLLGGMLVCAPASAEIFKYIDRDGNVLFTDKPVKDPYYKLEWQKNPSKWGVAQSPQPRVNVNAYKRNLARFAPIIEEVASSTRLYPELLHAVVMAESSYDPEAVSPTGAVGLMQLMPATAKRYGVTNARDPRANLEGGARYLRDLLTMFSNNLKLALAAYNAGENTVRKYGNQVPPYPETREYVNRVIAYYKANRKQRELAAN